MRKLLVAVAIVAAAIPIFLLAVRSGAPAAAAAPHPALLPSSAAQPAAAPSDAPGERPEVPPPPFTDGIFPCSGCHDGKTVPVNTTRRKLEMHDDIVLRHDEKHRWCLDCHDPIDRDQLHLASGERIPFTESYRLCGQCHGEKLRDWRAGVHGRRVGQWNGHKQYLLCPHCHNPHQPRFKALQPKPAPNRPMRPGA